MMRPSIRISTLSYSHITTFDRCRCAISDERGKERVRRDLLQIFEDDILRWGRQCEGK